MATTYTLRRKLFATVKIDGKSILGLVQNRGGSIMTSVAPGVRATGSKLGGKAAAEYADFWKNANLKNIVSSDTNTILGTATKRGKTRTITSGNVTRRDRRGLKKLVAPQSAATTAPKPKRKGIFNFSIGNVSSAPLPTPKPAPQPKVKKRKIKLKHPTAEQASKNLPQNIQDQIAAVAAEQSEVVLPKKLSDRKLFGRRKIKIEHPTAEQSIQNLPQNIQEQIALRGAEQSGMSVPRLSNRQLFGRGKGRVKHINAEQAIQNLPQNMQEQIARRTLEQSGATLVPPAAPSGSILAAPSSAPAPKVRRTRTKAPVPKETTPVPTTNNTTRRQNIKKGVGYGLLGTTALVGTGYGISRLNEED